jgi:oligopeptide/dipeptide ABC transporter ATP-binding protein
MYLGAIVEEGPAAEIYSSPAHPYTRALLSAVPVPEPGAVRDRIVLTGDVPTAIDRPAGCPFRTRCYKVQDVCATARPALEPVAGGDHRVACYFPETLEPTGAGGDRLQCK